MTEVLTLQDDERDDFVEFAELDSPKAAKEFCARWIDLGRTNRSLRSRNVRTLDKKVYARRGMRGTTYLAMYDELTRQETYR